MLEARRSGQDYFLLHDPASLQGNRESILRLQQTLSSIRDLQPEEQSTIEDLLNERRISQQSGHYKRNEDDRMPPAGRYNAGQKLLFWGFFWCSLLLLLTGAILWFPEYIPWSLRFLRYIAVLIHPVAALLTIGLFLIHIYMSVFAERGAFGSVIRGDVSEAFAKRYHPGWYKEIAGGPSSPRK